LEGLELDNIDQTTGVKIVYNAIQAPLRTIVSNAGGEASVVVNAVLAGKDDYGFNAATGEYVNMFKAGIIDPTKVTRLALENAASIAALLLTTECVIADHPEEEAAPPLGGGMPGGMGGMM
ncbi:MAG: TCP-1/cpn60 chaperonin family protein, partial [Marinoscillum sp.]